MPRPIKPATQAPPLPPPPPVAPEPTMLNGADLKEVLYKVNQCIDYHTLYALEPEFNKVGLTIQTSSKNRTVLCKLIDGKPITESIIDDYIFIGTLDGSSTELSERAIEKVSDFIRASAGPPSKVQNIARTWRDGLRMYAADIEIVNEDINKVAGEIIE